MREVALERLSVEATVKVSERYQTLFLGLKLNHERNVAVVHPLMFLVRRVVYALVIVCMGEVMVAGVLIVMLSCLAMLAYALSEF